MSIKNSLRKNNSFRSLYFILNAFRPFFSFKPFQLIKSYAWFLNDYLKHSSMQEGTDAIPIKILQPELADKTTTTPVDPVYFYQDSWAAKQIFRFKPKRHYDVGSFVKTVGILSQFVPTTMVDIRPIDLELPGLSFKEGTILDLPFADDSVESISSICVIEHIGLGRYGDPIDPFGTEKAAKELQRVTMEGGHIIISVPVDDENKVYFNAQRAYSRDYVLQLFPECTVEEEAYIYKRSLYPNYDPEKGYGTGLFLFRKNSVQK